MFGTDWMIVGEKTDGSVTYAAELDIMGHETNHGVVNASSTLLQGVYTSSDARQKSSQLAMGEGLAQEEGLRGWAIKTQSNIFGYTDWNINRPANAWYCMHLWQHYLYTQDVNFLVEKAFPVMQSIL